MGSSKYGELSFALTIEGVAVRAMTVVLLLLMADLIPITAIEWRLGLAE